MRLVVLRLSHGSPRAGNPNYSHFSSSSSSSSSWCFRLVVRHIFSSLQPRNVPSKCEARFQPLASVTELWSLQREEKRVLLGPRDGGRQKTNRKCRSKTHLAQNSHQTLDFQHWAIVSCYHSLWIILRFQNEYQQLLKTKTAKNDSFGLLYVWKCDVKEPEKWEMKLRLIYIFFPNLNKTKSKHTPVFWVQAALLLNLEIIVEQLS